jgi:KipI family sensor histidine kinase inhibitor
MRTFPASDRSLLIHEADPVRLFRLLQRHPVPAVTSLSPAADSLLVRFDPRFTAHEVLAEQILELVNASAGEPDPEPQQHTIAVDFRSNVAPDLAELAELHRLTPAQLVDCFTAVEYEVRFLGFLPGFAYLGGVPDAIATPRRASPRKQVPAGSVGIAGTYAGIYPQETPGGWNLIGRADAVLFDFATLQPLWQPGDRVRFLPRPS